MLKVLAILSLAAVSLGSPLGVHYEEDKLSPPIVGGGPVDIADFPYQLAFNSGGGFCGASIISKDWALTAAHCTTGTSVGVMSLRAGSTNRNSGGSVHNVIKKVEHPNHKSSSQDWDYSLLQVEPPFEWGPGVAAIPLVDAGVEFPEGTVALVSGWGTLRYGGLVLPENLQAVEVPLTSVDTCTDAYGKTITDRMICAAVPEGGKDSCQGDSGGPLVVNSALAGIVPFGQGCGSPGFPGVYAKVSDQRDWIKETTGA